MTSKRKRSSDESYGDEPGCKERKHEGFVNISNLFAPEFNNRSMLGKAFSEPELSVSKERETSCTDNKHKELVEETNDVNYDQANCEFKQANSINVENNSIPAEHLHWCYPNINEESVVVEDEDNRHARKEKEKQLEEDVRMQAVEKEGKQVENEEKEDDRKRKEDAGRVRNNSNGNNIVSDKSSSEMNQHNIFVHSCWLAVQSQYFRALFYSGMKVTF